MANQNPDCIESSIHGASVVLTILDERIRDAERVNQLKDSMLAVVQSGNYKNVIVDLKRVTFIGSVGFLAFLSIRRVPGVEQVLLCNMDDNVKQLFSLCRLINDSPGAKAPFQAASTVEAALESVS